MVKPLLRIVSMVFLLIVIFWSFNLSITYFSYLDLPKTQLYINGTIFGTYIAETEEDRTKGLSGRGFLPAGMSMLFLFDRPEKAGIWMKDMRFPIDIIWLDSYKRVIHELPNVSPKTYPTVFYPSSEALYVVELQAGTIENKNIKEGDVISFDI